MNHKLFINLTDRYRILWITILNRAASFVTWSAIMYALLKLPVSKGYPWLIYKSVSRGNGKQFLNSSHFEIKIANMFRIWISETPVHNQELKWIKCLDLCIFIGAFCHCWTNRQLRIKVYKFTKNKSFFSNTFIEEHLQRTWIRNLSILIDNDSHWIQC